MDTSRFAPTVSEIAARAHALWEAEGRPAGRETEHWLRAECELLAAGTTLRTERPVSSRTTKTRPDAKRAAKTAPTGVSSLRSTAAG